jgi:soluble cytochrome b562
MSIPCLGANYLPRRFNPELITNMKLFKKFLPLAVILAFGGAVASAEDTPLEKEMDAMNKAYKALKKSVSDPAAKDENLKLIAEIKKTTASSTKLEPKKAADEGAKKAEFVESYKKAMEEFSKAVDALEAAVTAGKTEDAKAAYDKLLELKKEGHKKYKKD